MDKVAAQHPQSEQNCPENQRSATYFHACIKVLVLMKYLLGHTHIQELAQKHETRSTTAKHDLGTPFVQLGHHEFAIDESDRRG